MRFQIPLKDCSFNTTTKCFNVFQFNDWYQWCATCIPPASPVGSSNSPLCDGETLNLFANSDVPGVSYHWTGPGGFTSNEQNPVIANVNYGQSGTYSVTTTLDNCTTPPQNVSVIISTPPAQPSSISGESCLEQAELVNNSYSVVNVPGTTYNWSITPSSGVSLIPSGNSCLITFPSGVVDYTLSVVPSMNACIGAAQTLAVSTKNICSVSYANGNEAYWTERNLGFRDVIIGGGSTVYIYDNANKQYVNGNNILIPNLVGTPNGQTVSDNNFFGFSGGFPADVSYQWDNATLAPADQGPDYNSTWDRAPMFVSPSFTGLTYFQVLDDSYTGDCSGWSGTTLQLLSGISGLLSGAEVANPGMVRNSLIRVTWTTEYIQIRLHSRVSKAPRIVWYTLARDGEFQHIRRWGIAMTICLAVSVLTWATIPLVQMHPICLHHQPIIPATRTDVLFTPHQVIHGPVVGYRERIIISDVYLPETDKRSTETIIYILLV